MIFHRHSVKILGHFYSKEFVRFLIVGIVAFSIDTAILNITKFVILDGRDEQILGAFALEKVVSSSFGVTVSFFLNRHWSFKAGHMSVTKQAVKFLGVFMINIVIASFLFDLFEPVLESTPLIENLGDVIPSLTNVLVTGIIMFISFTFYKFFVFKLK